MSELKAQLLGVLIVLSLFTFLSTQYSTWVEDTWQSVAEYNVTSS